MFNDYAEKMNLLGDEYPHEFKVYFYHAFDLNIFFCLAPIRATRHRPGDGQQAVPELFIRSSNSLQHIIAPFEWAVADGQTGTIAEDLQHPWLSDCEALVRKIFSLP